MVECPVLYYEENLIFGSDNSCWGAFEIKGFNYETLPRDEKTRKLRSLETFISDIYDEAEFLILPYKQDVDRHTKQLLKRVNAGKSLLPFSVSHIEGAGKYVREWFQGKRITNDYRFFVFVKLVSEPTRAVIKKAKPFLDLVAKIPINQVNRQFGIEKKDILESQVKHYKELSQQFFDRQAYRVKIRKASPYDIQDILKRVTTYRGMEDKIRYNLTTLKIKDDTGKKTNIIHDWIPASQRISIRNGNDKIIRPHTPQIINLMNGVIDKSGWRILKITHEDGSVMYQTFLALTHMPDEQVFPGCEYLFTLQQLPFPVETCVRIKNIANPDAEKVISDKQTEINTEIDNIQEVGDDVPREITEGKIDAGEIRGKIKQNRLPLCQTCISIAISDPDRKELERKVKIIKSLVEEDLKFRVEQPASDQISLFMQHIPASNMYTKAFNLLLLPEAVAAGMIGASTKLGDNIGPMIGVTDRNKVVNLLMAHACQRNQSASVFVGGNPGSGKSFNTNLLVYLNILMGGKALILCPKGERKHWDKELPIPKELISIVTLSGDSENAGRLDPFLIYLEDFDEAANLAVNILVDLFEIKTASEQYVILSESIETMRETQDTAVPCMQRLVEIMEAVPESDDLHSLALKLARLIRTMQNHGVTKLLFGNGTEQGIKLHNVLNIIQLQNLNMPKPEVSKENYSEDEKKSVILFSVVGSFAKKFILTAGNVFKTILIDESWMISKTTQGLALFHFLSRMGRSLNAGCIFNCHSVLDLASDALKNTITYYFIFRTKDAEECKRMLEFIGMDVTDDNIDRIMNLRDGQCFFKDLDGNIGKMQFDYIFDDLKRVFDTTPEDANPEREPEEPTDDEEKISIMARA